VKISGFTFGHNAIEGGYPIVEAILSVYPYVSEMVAVDIESTDNTRHVFEQLGCRILDSKLNGTDTVNDAFKLHTACQGDLIIFFEADEVYDERLLDAVSWAIEQGKKDIAVYRIQVTQNFQRIKEYPIPVHRVFPHGGGSYVQHPTRLPDYPVHVLPPSAGYLWGCSGVFRDNWKQRKANQAKLFGQSRPIYVPGHFTEHFEFWGNQEDEELAADYWEWTASPFDLPEVLKPLVGQVVYDPKI
jgi:hypothetical protein